MHCRHLRRAIGDSDKTIVKTVPKQGYRLTPTAERDVFRAPRWLVAACLLILLGAATAWTS